MKFRLKVGSILECGKRKDSQGNPHQEDCLYPASGKESDGDRTFILCDGMGGHEAGEVASEAVCTAMSRSILDDGHDSEGIFTLFDFNNALDEAFRTLDEKDTGGTRKMGTTLAFLKLHDKGAFIAHMGDSRIYHIRPGKTAKDTEILHETWDHSLVNQLVKTGELTREEARVSGQRNVITRALQPHLDSRPNADIYETSDIKPGDYFYLCSDGMLEEADMDNGDALRYIFSEDGGSLEEKIRVLRIATADNRDNHSAIVVEVEDVITPEADKAIDEDEKGKKRNAGCLGIAIAAIIILLSLCL